MQPGAFGDKSLVWNLWLRFNEKKKEGFGYVGIFQDFNASPSITHFLSWFSDDVQNKVYACPSPIATQFLNLYVFYMWKDSKDSTYSPERMNLGEKRERGRPSPFNKKRDDSQTLSCLVSLGTQERIHMSKMF